MYIELVPVKRVGFDRTQLDLDKATYESAT